MPTLDLNDCQESVALDLHMVEERLKHALRHIQAEPPGSEEAVLKDLQEVELSIIDDESIADVHGRFMQDPTATDVITFQHGEVLASADTALREAADRGWPVERELLLYLIHGLLHLHGYDDRDSQPREAMHAVQESILERVWPMNAPEASP